MKVGLASFLSCLAILLGLYTTTGTASAHSAIHPFINVVSNLHRFGNCVSFVLEGGDFTPHHHVDLFASASGGASIDPDRVRANGNGRFLVDATACANQQFENCGDFIESPTFFCGFNLNQQDFCGFDGFPGGQCFFGSAMKSLDCNPPFGPLCQQGPFPGPGLGNPPCPFNNQLLPGCFPFQPRFRFHPVSVFDFCRFHFGERFPFCFRFFPREFPIQIGILAVDEHTGKRAHVGIGIG